MFTLVKSKYSMQDLSPFFLDNLLCGSVKNTQTAGKTICFTHILIMVSHILNIKMLIIPSSKCLNAEMIQKKYQKIVQS